MGLNLGKDSAAIRWPLRPKTILSVLPAGVFTRLELSVAH